MLACRSITLTIDDMTDELIRKSTETHGELLSLNHVQALEEFGVPKGWKLVYKKYGKMFTSPSLGLEVSGYGVRFEKA